MLGPLKKIKGLTTVAIGASLLYEGLDLVASNYESFTGNATPGRRWNNAKASFNLLNPASMIKKQVLWNNEKNKMDIDARQARRLKGNTVLIGNRYIGGGY
jgi:hypothetical protein